MYNAALCLLILCPCVVVIYGAFFRKIEKINEQPEEEDSITEDLTHGIDKEMYN